MLENINENTYTELYIDSMSASNEELYEKLDDYTWRSLEIDRRLLYWKKYHKKFHKYSGFTKKHIHSDIETYNYTRSTTSTSSDSPNSEYDLDMMIFSFPLSMNDIINFHGDTKILAERRMKPEFRRLLYRLNNIEINEFTRDLSISIDMQQQLEPFLKTCPNIYSNEQNINIICKNIEYTQIQLLELSIQVDSYTPDNFWTGRKKNEYIKYSWIDRRLASIMFTQYRLIIEEDINGINITYEWIKLARMHLISMASDFYMDWYDSIYTRY